MGAGVLRPHIQEHLIGPDIHFHQLGWRGG
jgi:hypothetical protein